ncbi:MAG TPA: hypothetical protein VMR18_04575 [Candidatus Saccharimonadales bacterium]|nr:hypothetical protein [Candidatus Saccharimonadales bacterium]
MENAKQQAIERIKQANNVLVTVSNNPSVDQLSACIALTLILNKLGKHGTAVYSGQTPSIIEFLQPEKTIEKNTDSLRDFIIALDKSKADKLRYKVEDKVVKIFITPYRTSISKDDLDFSQGDFNVDVVIGLGVHQQSDLDQAITAHGRILHDATVITFNVTPNGDLGSINWQDPSASSLSELVSVLATEMGSSLLDNQIATALLTGIVAETNRFSNDKTSAKTMSISSQLISAGANQQLVASKLDQPAKQAANPGSLDSPKKDSPLAEPADGDQPTDQPDDGAIEISHNDDNTNEQPPPPQIDIDDHGNIMGNDDSASKTDQAAQPTNQSELSGGTALVTEPPILGGTLTANSSQTEDVEPSTDPLSLPTVQQPLLNRQPLGANNPLPDRVPTDGEPQTLSQIEQAVNSPHLSMPEESTVQPFLEPPPNPQSTPEPLPELNPEIVPEQNNNSPVEEPSAGNNADQNNSSSEEPHIDNARDAVQAAINASPETQPLEPVQSLNAQPVFDSMNDDTHDQDQENPLPVLTPAPTVAPSSQSFVSPQGSPVPPQDTFADPTQPNHLDTFNMPMPQQPLQPFSDPSMSNNPSPFMPSADNDNPPPPVPPPMMPPVV